MKHVKYVSALAITWLALPLQAAWAQDRVIPAGSEVCVSIDAARDTLTPQERAAATLLIAREFETAGMRVLTGDCAGAYTLAHARLGRTIAVTLAGPNGRRDGTALGLDDLPSLYSQLVRSIVTGRPMTSRGIVDRGNVTVAQTSTSRVPADSFTYTRLGFGGIFADRAHGATAIGFGHRVELDGFAVDVSFFNAQIHQSNSGYYTGSSGDTNSTSASYLKCEGLRFFHPKADASLYAGAGLSYGGVSVSSGASTASSALHGSGLQGELTFGYELARASTVRLFIQTDAVLPFYRAVSETWTYSRGYVTGVSSTSRYVPSVSISVGIGWQHGRHR